MKGLKYSKKIKEETLAFAQLIETYSSKINKEYMKHMIQMIETISFDHNLDVNVMKTKYIKSSKSFLSSGIDEDEDEDEEDETDTSTSMIPDVVNDNVLDKVIYMDRTYYVDKTGTAFDKSKNVMGTYINKTMVLYK